MNSEAVVRDSAATRLDVTLLNVLLAFMCVLFLLSGIFLVDSAPNVGVRPGVRSTVAPDGDRSTPVTDCGGTSLQVIFRGAQVVAETSQQARAAEGACQRAAWISQVSGVVLFLLIPVGWYGAFRANTRYEGQHAVRTRRSAGRR
jgi:succinate dehydrogenase hydrophobic anchor subunit